MYAGIWRCFCKVVYSRKIKNKSTDGLLGTLECNDMSRLLKNPVACLKNLDLASCNACNLIFQCALAKWSYFKALYHSIHDDVSLSIWGRIVNKTPGQNTPEKTLQANLLKKFYWKIFIRLSAIIYKPVQGWLSVNGSQYISPVQKKSHVHCSF